MDNEIRQPPSAVHVRSGSYALAWVLLLVGIGVAVTGVLLGWAQRWVWYDEAIHTYNFFAASLVLGLHLYGRSLTGYPRRKLLIVLTLLCLAVTLGVVWEWAELAYDRLSGRESVIKGKFDTLLDLAMDGLGGAIAGIVMLTMLRPARPERAHDEQDARADVAHPDAAGATA